MLERLSQVQQLAGWQKSQIVNRRHALYVEIRLIPAAAHNIPLCLRPAERYLNLGAIGQMACARKLVGESTVTYGGDVHHYFYVREHIRVNQ